MDSRQFLSELFEDMVDDDIRMYIWSPGLGSFQFTSHEEAAAHVEKIKAGKNIYYGPGATRVQFARDKRPTNLQVAAIPGLWLDIDIADPQAHKKENLPVTQEDAIDLLVANLPLKPTILVNTGHGLHAYWLFKEPWIFETEDERIQAATLLRRFVLSFKYHAALRGWALDSVFDLTRVLRIPGTDNCKVEGHPIPCSVLEFNEDARYNPEDFEKYLVDTSEAGSEDSISELLTADKNPLGLFLRPGATPPHAKMETLRTVEPKFDATWERQRPDFKDQSLSTYEMSLSNLMVGYGWPDQEIADTIIAFRRKHGKNQKEINKGLRIDYITRTILKSRRDLKQPPVDPKVLEMSNQVIKAQKEPDAENKGPTKDEIRDALEELLQVKINKIIKYACDNPLFEIQLMDGSIIPVGTIDKLITQRNLKHALAAHRGVVPRGVKANIWDEYATLMLQLVETVQPLVEDSTEKGILSSMIEQYLEKMGVVDDMESAFYSSRPFIYKGKVYLFSKHFVNWTKFNGEPVSIREFSMTARSMNISTEKLHFRFGDDGKKTDTMRSVYDVTVFAPSDKKPACVIPDQDSPTHNLEVVQ